jgi:hypothetical protein
MGLNMTATSTVETAYDLSPVITPRRSKSSAAAVAALMSDPFADHLACGAPSMPQRFRSDDDRRVGTLADISGFQ